MRTAFGLGVSLGAWSCLASACVTAAAPAPPTPATLVDEDAPAGVAWITRHAQGTKIARPAGPAPALHLDETMESVRFRSGGRELMAIVARPPRTPLTSTTPQERLPAVLFLHPGFALDDDALAWAAPFVDAGFIVMLPAWRGENNNPGAVELFFGEVDDARSAARALAEDPDVDVDHLYAFGHGIGGGIAALLALDPDAPFRMIASSSGVTSAPALKAAPLSIDDVDERVARAFLPHAHELARPLTIYAGDAVVDIARTAQQRTSKITLIPVEGDALHGALDLFLKAALRDASPTPSPTPPVAFRSAP